jgi:hypothetical protein
MGCNCSKSNREPEPVNAKDVTDVPKQQAPMAEQLADQASALYSQISAAVTGAPKADSDGISEQVKDGEQPAPVSTRVDDAVKNISGAVQGLLGDMAAGIAAATAEETKKKKKKKKKKGTKPGEPVGDESPGDGSDAGQDATDASPVADIPAVDTTEFQEAVDDKNQSYEAYYSADSEKPTGDGKNRPAPMAKAASKKKGGRR